MLILVVRKCDFSCRLIPGAANLHDLILELWQEEVDDLVLLDGEGVKVDLLHGLDLSGLDETSKLGDWLPLLLLVLVGATASTATSTSSITTATVSSAICLSIPSAIRPVFLRFLCQN